MPGDHIHIVGARPNFMKAAPVVGALQRMGERPVLIHTGQHYDPSMSDVFFHQLGLPEPEENLGVGSGSHGTQTAALLVALEELFERRRPSRVVVYGDVNSTLAAAVCASKLHIPIAHVEAGLRSFDRTMPEEINRVVTDALADMHFVTSPEAMGHLAREGIPAEFMHFVGNPMIDTLRRFQDLVDVEATKRRLGVPDSYGVVTVHRPSNVDDDTTSSAWSKGCSESRSSCRSSHRFTRGDGRSSSMLVSSASSRSWNPSAMWTSSPSLPGRSSSSRTRVGSRRRRPSSGSRA